MPLRGVIQRRQGAYLPHWTAESATYAVTFRLADSLPREVLEQFARERQSIIERAEANGRPLTDIEHNRLSYLHSARVEAFLDSGAGQCWMKDDRIAGIVESALRHFDGVRLDLWAWSVMPNHVHAVVAPRTGHSLPSILQSWKGFTAHAANRALGRQGEFWQAESYDHLIRDEEDLAHAVEYVLKNPERAGLSTWRFVGAKANWRDALRARP